MLDWKAFWTVVMVDVWLCAGMCLCTSWTWKGLAMAVMVLLHAFLFWVNDDVVSEERKRHQRKCNELSRSYNIMAWELIERDHMRRKQLEEANDKVHELRIKRNEWKRHCRDRDDMLRHSRAVQDGQRTELGLLHNQVEDLQAQVQGLLGEVEGMQGQVRDVQSRAAHNVLRIGVLRRKNASSEARLTAAQAELSATRSQLSTTRTELSTTSKKLKQANTQLADVEAELQEAEEERDMFFGDWMREEGSNLELEAENTSLTASLRQHKSAHTAALAQLQAYKTLAAAAGCDSPQQLDQHLRGLNSRAAHRLVRVAVLRRKNKSSEARLSATKTQLTATQTKLKDSAQEADQFLTSWIEAQDCCYEHIRIHNDSMQAWQRRSDAQEAALNTLRSQHRALQAAYSSSNSQQQSLQAQLSALRSQYEALQGEHVLLQGRCAEWEQLCADQHSEVLQLTASLNSLTANLNSLTAEKVSLTAQQSNLADELHSLRSQHLQLESEAEALRGQAAAAHKDISGLQEALQQKQGEVAELQAALSAAVELSLDLSLGLEGAAVELEVDSDQSKDEVEADNVTLITSLHARLSEKTAALVAEATRGDNLAHENSLLRGQVEELQDQLEDFMGNCRCDCKHMHAPAPAAAATAAAAAAAVGFTAPAAAYDSEGRSSTGLCSVYAGQCRGSAAAVAAAVAVGSGSNGSNGGCLCSSCGAWRVFDSSNSSSSSECFDSSKGAEVGARSVSQRPSDDAADGGDQL